MLIYPENGSVIDTHTDLQNEFIRLIETSGISSALEWLLPLKDGTELSYPEPITFRWMPDGQLIYRFELSETESFASSFSIQTSEPFFTMTNLKIGQTYNWRVNGGNFNTFQTKNNKFRFLQVDGVLNVRDLGGIKIKQGLLFRGSEINWEYHITDTGKRVLTDFLKVKTELNLRKELFCQESCLGDTVCFIYLPYRPYREIFEEEHRIWIKAIMEFLAEEEHYPIYFHCLGGADRTGMIALYLRALAGEEDADIFTDYELTSLSAYAYGLAEGVSSLGFRSREADYFQEFLSAFHKYEGSSLKEKTEAFLLECNVKPSTIEKIRRILLKE